MTPTEKEHIEAIARIAFFALGGHVIDPDKEQRAMVLKLIDQVTEHCNALNVLPTREVGSDILKAVSLISSVTIVPVGPQDDPSEAQ